MTLATTELLLMKDKVDKLTLADDKLSPADRTQRSLQTKVAALQEAQKRKDEEHRWQLEEQKKRTDELEKAVAALLAAQNPRKS
jgi:hypothetical protein